MSYTSHADLGGQAGYGAVVPEPEGDQFHAPWEPRALALSLAMGATGSWNIDIGRSARETLPDYARLSYYEVWTFALQRLLEERHLADADEIEVGHMLRRGPPVKRVLHAGDVQAVLAGGSPTLRPSTESPRFDLGQRVRTMSTVVGHHTRLPGYVRGREGVIERIHGAHIFADTHAQGLGEQPQFLYTVVFAGTELWSESGGARGLQSLTVSVDAWESYLEPA